MYSTTLQLLAVIWLAAFSFCQNSSKKFVDNSFLEEFWGNYYGDKYRQFSETTRLQSKEAAKKMFYFAYDSYMKFAFPQDELNPIACSGRGPDFANPSNLNINDVLGNFSLGLVDSLDTLASTLLYLETLVPEDFVQTQQRNEFFYWVEEYIMGNSTEFKHAVQLVIDNVSFDVNSTVQVFETNIRVLGALLSAHLIITDPEQVFGDMTPKNYDNHLLYLAHDLANRLLPAFEKTKNGIPYPRVNLQLGVPNDTITQTATAGAGSLLLEFGALSRLLGDPTFENAARRAVDAIWARRNSRTGLIGVAIDVTTGKWVGRQSGLGAGVDSFFEYLLKAYIVFSDPRDLEKFNEGFASIRDHIRRGRKHCNRGSGDPPIYVNVDLSNGYMVNTWIDSLQAFLPGLLVLNGDIEEAICCHALYYAIWRRYEALPERFNWQSKAPDVRFYPLRPELIESTYLLYRATKNPFYLHVGREILDSLERHARTKCGYASLHNVLDKSQEDRMESFFLSETCKYLYLLFDFENPLHNGAEMRTIFTTEGHLIPTRLEKTWESYLDYCYQDNGDHRSNTSISIKRKCDRVTPEQTFSLPLRRDYFKQLAELVGHVT